MTHDDVAYGDVIDRYLEGELSEGDRQAFEEHFFGCQVSFDGLREEERIRAAIQAGAREGWLGGERAATPSAWTWLLVAASVAALGVSSWLTIRSQRVPGSPAVTNVAAARDVAAPDAAARLQSRAALEPNISIAVLEAQRDAATVPRVVVPKISERVVLWISAPDASGPGRLTVSSASGAPLLSLDRLVRNSSGAYVWGFLQYNCRREPTGSACSSRPMHRHLWLASICSR